eukprot:1879710-Rhodomonas_salina.3
MAALARACVSASASSLHPDVQRQQRVRARSPRESEREQGQVGRTVTEGGGQDEELDEDEKMRRCMALAGHPDWTPKPLTEEEK